MTQINGTSGADIIDVTGDVGTLNGTPQGGPITGIDGADSFDTITVSNSTITGTINSSVNGMDLTVAGSDINTISADGNSTVTLSGSSVNTLNTGNSAVTVNATNTDFGYVNSSAGGGVTFNMTGSSLDEFQGGSGEDIVTLTDVTLPAGTNFRSNVGNDTLTLNNTAVGDNFIVQLSSGSNTLNIEGNTSFGNSTFFDAANSGTNQINLPDGTVLTVDGLGTFTVGTDTLPSGSNLNGSFVLPNGSGASFTDFDQFGSTGAPVCYTEGTLILTPSGEVPIETLAVGDLVMTAEGKAEPILWIGARVMEFYDHQSMHRPVLIKRGALGAGRPTRDLAVSPQHCLLIDMPADPPVFGTKAAFARAKFLTGLPGVRVMKGKKRARYVTFLLARHQLVQANGAWSESFYPGHMGLKMLPAAKRREVENILSERRTSPDCGYGPRAARVLTRRDTEQLVGILRAKERGRPLMVRDQTAVCAAVDQAEPRLGHLHASSQMLCPLEQSFR